MGFYDKFMVAPPAPAEPSDTQMTASTSFYNDDLDAPVLYQTPGRGTPRQALGRPLQRHGAFCQISTSGEVSPSPPLLPLVFIEQTHEPVFELGDDTPRTTKHMRLCIEEASNEAGLDKENMKAAEQFSMLHTRQRDTVLFIKLQGIEKLLQGGAQAFQEPDSRHAALLLDTGFKSHLQMKIVGCLLSPDIMGYLAEVAKAIMNLIRQNPDLFNVPDNFFENQTLAFQLQKLVTEGLASARGSIKAKLNHSLGKKRKGVQAKPQPIRTLCSSLAISGMEIKGAHWTRAAYLRYCLLEFKKFEESLPTTGSSGSSGGSVAATSSTPSESSTVTAAQEKQERNVKEWYSSTQFWNFVDDSLKDVHMDALKAGQTKSGQQQKLIEFFQLVLVDDLKAYALPSNFKMPALDTTAVVTAWQRKFNKAMTF